MNYLYASVLAAGASIYDLREDRIPNALVICGVLGGYVCIAMEHGLGGVVAGSISAVIVFAILFPVYLIRGIGAGDVKLMSAIALFFEPEYAIRFLLICAGASAVCSAVRIITYRQFFSRLCFIKGYISDCVAAGRILPYHTSESLESYIRLAPCMLFAVIAMYLMEVFV